MKIKYIEKTQLSSSYSSIQPDSTLSQTKKGPDGREYYLLGVSEKDYNKKSKMELNKHRFVFFVKAFAKTFFTLGGALLFKKTEALEDWKALFTGKRKVIVYSLFAGSLQMINSLKKPQSVAENHFLGQQYPLEERPPLGQHPSVEEQQHLVEEKPQGGDQQIVEEKPPLGQQHPAIAKEKVYEAINKLDLQQVEGYFNSGYSFNSKESSFLLEQAIAPKFVYSLRRHMQEAKLRAKKAIISLLIEKGADLNQKDENGLTPLYHAVKTQELEVVKYLIENGANKDILIVEKDVPLTLLEFAKKVKEKKLESAKKFKEENPGANMKVNLFELDDIIKLLDVT